MRKRQLKENAGRLGNKQMNRCDGKVALPVHPSPKSGLLELAKPTRERVPIAAVKQNVLSLQLPNKPYISRKNFKFFLIPITQLANICNWVFGAQVEDTK